MHPPYSPDLAPSDYHLYQSLKNSLNGVKLVSKEVCENHLIQFFAQKSRKFYSDGIMILLEKWQKLIDQNGTCSLISVGNLYEWIRFEKHEKKTGITFSPTQYVNNRQISRWPINEIVHSTFIFLSFIELNNRRLWKAEENIYRKFVISYASCTQTCVYQW